MFPVHQFDLHPHQRNEMQSTPRHYPSFEAVPPQMGASPDRFQYQSWPCSSNYAYAHPAQFHGCCEHSPFSGYYGPRSPYSQPPPHYYHGNYFVPPGAYHIHYIPPPPHHIMGAPHYEYDKNMGEYYHCCGCPNNSCNGKGGKFVKIEESDPHLESKADESLVPFNFRDYSDPLVWLSPSDSRTQMGRRTNDLRYEKQKDSSHCAKPHYPPYPISWFPSNQIGNQLNKKSNEPMPEKQDGEITSTTTNCPYPILWFPPAYISNKEDSVSNEQKAEQQKGSPNVLKTSDLLKVSEHQQDFMNGWFPFSMNKLTPSKSGSQGKELQQQGEDKPGFACPVFWMPYETDGKVSKDNIRSGVSQECAQRTPPHFEVSSEMVPATKEEEDNNEGNEKVTACESPAEMVKTNTLKIIPVKQGEPIEGENKGESAKSSEISVNCSDAGKLSKDGGKKKSPSPTRSSKLPPVCLRVDPIPRKKTANGSSRSPSPPGDKGKSIEVSGEDLSPGASLDTKQGPQPSLPNDSVAVSDQVKRQVKSKVRTIQVSEGTGSEAVNNEISNTAPDVVHANQTSDKPAVEDLSASDVKCKSVAGVNSEGVVEDKSMHFGSGTAENVETLNAEAKHPNVAKEPKRITLSEVEAACIIQTAYRGYAVRKLELLVKLKQVTEVKKKVAELKGTIEAFESSLDIQGIDKWRTVIGETIMSLLLKLDTVQGVHPSIRDFRRSVAKELVGLQEKVDHITQKKAEIVSQQDSRMEGMDIKADLCNKRDQEEEKLGQQGSVAESQPVNELHLEAACEAENNHAPQESITEATAETKSLYGDPRSHAVSNSQTPVMPMKVANESEISLEPISKPGPAERELGKTLIFHQVDDPVINPALGGISSLQENEVSVLKRLEEFPKGEISEDISTADNLVQKEPAEDRASEDVSNDLPKGVLEQYNDMKDNTTLVKDSQGTDEVLAESCLEPELVQLAPGVLDDDCESPVHFQIEKDGKKHKTDEMLVDVNEGRAGCGVHDMNHVETTLKVPVTLGANESQECAEQKDNNIELLKKADLGSKDVVQALEEDASCKSMDISEAVRGEEKMEACADVINDKSEVNGCIAVKNEIPAATTIITPETCEEEKLSFLGRESVNASGNDSINSSNEDEHQACVSPVKLSKSCAVEHEEKQVNDNFEQQASGEADGIDTTYNSGALEAELLGGKECYSSKDKQGEEQALPPPSPSASEISLESDGFSEGDRKLIEENMKLREMMQKLIESGRDQLTAISNLSSRVKELEKRISKKKKLRMRRHGIPRSSSGSSCFRSLHDPEKVNAVAMAM